MTKVIDLREEVRNKMHQTTKSNEEAYYTFDDIIGESKAIKELKYKAQKIARSNSPVFVYGETGTGKELLVQAIHNASPRKNGPFIAQNCAALPENLMESILFGTVKGSFTGAENRPGLVELADGGTLFLDEITSLSFDLQAKLLRFLQEGYIRRVGDSKIRKVNVRVISASNIPPQEALEKKILRPDLFYRLNSISLCVPPLRERKSDIPLLVKHFIEEFNRELRKNIKGISGEVERVLMSLSWPGNVRELKGVIEYAANFCEGEIIQLHDLPDYILKNAFIAGEKEITVKNTVEMKEKSIEDTIEEVGDLRAFLSRIEYELISKALKRTNGNVSRAAEILGIPRQTLQYKIKTLKITI
jgi:arginine utilization regulatory protein